MAEPRHDLAIYLPTAATFYDTAAGVVTSGGAERQTYLLARAMARRGLRVAHLVEPVAVPVRDPDAPVSLVPQPLPSGHGRPRDLAREAHAVWSGLDDADPAVVVVRGAQGALGVAGLWARARRRKLVFAAANDADFRGGPFAGRADPRGWVYRSGRRVADAVVVQSEQQLALAAELPRPPRRAVWIPSFVELAPTAPEPGDAFLWVSRLADYKQPLRYADLAEAVPEARFRMVATHGAEDATLRALRERAARLPNLELLEPLPHARLQELIGRSVAMVNTSVFEGMPNTWLEGWARGVPALTLQFDPDGRIAREGLGASAGGDWDAFVAGARDLWATRADRAALATRVRAYVGRVHGTDVEDAWQALLRDLASSS